MENTENLTSILNYLPQIAFCVRDGVLTEVNQNAKGHMITPGTPIGDLLASGAEEYADFTGGILYLTIRIADEIFDAAVSCIGNSHLFVLDREADAPELRALSLAAMHLRTPMSGLMISLDKLSTAVRDSGDTNLQEQLSRMNRSLYQMLRTISNMSDTARYATSTIPTLEAADARSFLDELFQKASLMLASSGYEFRFENMEHSLFCMLDTEKLERAFYNLLSNAMKFVAKDGQINVRAEQNGKQILLTVENDVSQGQNVIPDDLFRRYTRQPALEDARCGIGLGLTLVRLAASAHEGTVLLTQSGPKITVTMRLRIIKPSQNRVSSPIMRVDYTGERDHGLLELSDVLPPKLF